MEFLLKCEAEKYDRGMLACLRNLAIILDFGEEENNLEEEDNLEEENNR